MTCTPHEDPPEVVPENAVPPWQGIPVGSKRLDIQPVLDENGGKRHLNVTFGVYFSPPEFVQHVQQLVHPFDMPLPLDEANVESIGSILRNGPAAVAKHRAEALGHYVKRARELREQEKVLHENLDELAEPVLRSKRLLLKEMLKDAGVTDATLMDEMYDRFRLVGDLAASGQFQPQFKPAVLSMDQLKQTAVWAQKAVVSSCKRILEDKKMAVAVWEETIDQTALDKQWVGRPFSAEQISER